MTSNPPHIKHRKRGSIKNCAFLGNYTEDVDEGILEEVRIYNEVLGIPTSASCEGHLPDLSAYILGNITDEIQERFKNYMKELGISPINVTKWRTEYCIEGEKYNIQIILDGDYARGFDDGFSVHIESSIKDLTQEEWDTIRFLGFQKAINLRKNAICLNE